MRIIITVNTSWNIYNFRLGLIKALKKDGHEVIALAPADNYSGKLNSQGIGFHDISMNQKGTNPLEDILLTGKYISTFKKLKPDLVLSYTIKPNVYAGIACGILKIPIINNVSGLGTLFIRKSLASTIAKFLYRAAFKRSSFIFFQNTDDRDIFLQLKLVHANKVEVIPGSGVNVKKFNCTRTSNKGQKILFVGRIIGDKGIRELISAADKLSANHSGLEFNLVGELGYNNQTAISEDEVNSWLKKNPQIIMAGKTDDMLSVYRQADIMVLPSYREGLSKSLIEAAAMKLPIVSTNVPGCREVVDENKNGFLCEPKNPEALYHQLNKMITLNETRRLEMGEYSRSKAELEFDEQLVIKKYMEVINTISE